MKTSLNYNTEQKVHILYKFWGNHTDYEDSIAIVGDHTHILAFCVDGKNEYYCLCVIVVDKTYS